MPRPSSSSSGSEKSPIAKNASRREPERAQLPAEVRLEPRPPRFVALHVVHHHRDDRRDAEHELTDDGRTGEHAHQRARRVQRVHPVRVADERGLRCRRAGSAAGGNRVCHGWSSGYCAAADQRVRLARPGAQYVRLKAHAATPAGRLVPGHSYHVTLPLATSYIAPTIMISPLSSMSFRIGLVSRICCTPMRTLRSATFSTNA